MEPSSPRRIPPPAWAGRPPLMRVIGERCVDAVTQSVAGGAAAAAALVVADDRLVALAGVVVASSAVGGVAVWRQLSGLRKEAAGAPVVDGGPTRIADRGEHLVASAPWRWVGLLLALLPLDRSVGEVAHLGHPVFVAAAGLLLGLGIAAGACASWVRHWERREHLTLYRREVRTAPPVDALDASGRVPTPEEIARAQRGLMRGDGLDRKDRETLAWLEAQQAAEKARKGSPQEETSRRYVVVPHPGHEATGRPPEPSVDAPAVTARSTA